MLVMHLVLPKAFICETHLCLKVESADSHCVPMTTLTPSQHMSHRWPSFHTIGRDSTVTGQAEVQEQRRQQRNRAQLAEDAPSNTLLTRLPF